LFCRQAAGYEKYGMMEAVPVGAGAAFFINEAGIFLASSF